MLTIAKTSISLNVDILVYFFFFFSFLHFYSVVIH